MQDVLKTVLSELPDGVIVTTSSSTIVWANPAYCALTGYALPELVGRTPALLRSPSTTEGNRVEWLWDGLRTTGRFRGRLVNRRADGTLFHADVTMVQLPEGGATKGLFLGTLRDVSFEVDLESHLSGARAQAERSRDVTLLAMASLAEQRDPCTGAHLQRIDGYVRVMAEWICDEHPEAIPDWARHPETIGRCAVVHDIGKVGIPDAILSKRGRLTAEEQAIMREHPRIGAGIVERVLVHQPDSAFLRVARDIIAYHHEAWDGSGYPYSLSGDAIPMWAQLTTVADVFDALTSARPYKSANSVEESVDWISAHAGTRFGPLAVQAFRARLDALVAVRERWGMDDGHAPIVPSGMEPEPVVIPAAPGRDRLRAVLDQALSVDSAGEVLVQDGAVVGRVVVSRRRVAWIEVTGDRTTLADRLRSEAGVSGEVLANAIDVCRRTGRKFAEVLVAGGAVTQDVLREQLRALLAERLARLSTVTSPVVTWQPLRGHGEDATTFDLTELVVRT